MLLREEIVLTAVLLAVVGMLVFALGYRYYSKFIAERIYRLDPNYKTPAHQFNDGVDFVPTKKEILWGHHFTSVAGAAPILGPAIAVYWGWLPAVIWVLVGTVFAAGVHDFGALVISNRHKGNSMGTLATRIIGKRSKNLFLFIILILVLMVNAVFAWVIARLFISFPASVLPVMIEIPIAVWIGYLVYKKSKSLLLPSIVALVIMYGLAVITAQVPFLQIDIVNYFGGAEATGLLGLTAVESAFLIWIIILFAYGYIASTLPVWKLLQPRDYINSHQLIIGLFVLYVGMFFLRPEVTAPAFNTQATDVSWFPLLFITIACGAISGFHGLVASGTTSKQLDKETDARFVGYLGAVGEGTLALISIIAVMTAFATTGDFLAKYSSFSAASGAGLGTFVNGAAQLATGLWIPTSIGTTIVAVIVVSFAATTLDTSIRLMRYIIAELGKEYKIKALTGTHTATSVAVGTSALLVLMPGTSQGFGGGGYHLWPLFGTSNQLLAGITLLILTVWLKKLGRNYLPTLIPMIFLMFMTIWAMTQQVFFQWYGAGDKMLLFVLGAIILGFAIWILLEAFAALNRKDTPIDEDINA
jgi:carbon starvation protein